MAYTLAASLLFLFALAPAALPVRAWAETVATVAGEPISREELEKSVRPQLIEVENNKYEILEQGLDGMIAEKLLEKEAKARGISIEELQKQEIEAKITQPTDAEAQQVYDANKAQLGEATFEELKPRITAYLVNQRSQERATTYIDELKKKYETKVTLAPPKIEVGDGGRASRGAGKDAPVTIIAFSDYECPFCKKAEDTVAQVLKAYPNDVRYVHRDFPLPFHANAGPAAEAARCAGDQGKFWEYHDKVFHAADLTTPSLQQIATDLQLDRTKFDECLSGGTYKDEVAADMEAGSQVGVSGTPAFFINGRMISGAQPFERFKEIIDAELARAKAN
jgi:protein-disulfide isomerase